MLLLPVFQEKGIASGYALVMIGDQGNNYLSVAPGANYRLTPEKIDEAMPVIEESAMILMQYEIPEQTIKYVFDIAKEKNIPVLWNFAPARSFDLSYIGKTTILIVNETEAEFLCGFPVERNGEVEKAGHQLLRMGVELVIITLGKHGSFAFSGTDTIFVPAFHVDVVDTTSAGDVFCGSFAVAQVEGKSLKDSLIFASAAAALCVTKMGAQPSAPNRNEIEKLLNQSMSSNNPISRRRFVKASVLTATVAGAGALSSCTAENQRWEREEPFPVFKGNNYTPEDGVAGLLFSQVGYEPGFPVKVLLRLPGKDNLSESSICKLIPSSKEKDYATPCIYWGEKWGSHWWVAEFKDMDESGEWAIEVHDGGNVLWRDTGLKVGKDILWNSTIEWSAVDMLERRRSFAKVGAGWQDAGTLWVESPAQSTMIIALEELLELSLQRFEQSFIQRIYTQITVGCDYLVMTQAKARELGFEPGAMSHDLLGHEKDILPQDVWQKLCNYCQTHSERKNKNMDRQRSYLFNGCWIRQNRWVIMVMPGFSVDCPMMPKSPTMNTLPVIYC